MSKRENNKKKLFSKIDSIRSLKENEEKLKEIEDAVNSPFERLNQQGENFLDTLNDTFSQTIGNDNNVIFNFIKKIIRRSFEDADRLKKILIEELIKTVNCNVDLILDQEIILRRDEVDIYDILNYDPTNLPGKLIFEKSDFGSNPRPFNKQIQDVYLTSEEGFKPFISTNGLVLFDLKYDQNIDSFIVKFNGISIGDFLAHYYSSIELFEGKDLLYEILESIFSIYSNLLGTSTLNSKIELGWLFEKLASICGVSDPGNNIIEEGLSNFGDEEDYQKGFFTINDEDRRYIEKEKNLKINGLFELQECNDYQVKINKEVVISSILDLEYDDFDTDEVIEELVSNLSSNIVNNTTNNGINTDIALNFGINLPTVRLSIINRFIKEMPKALMSKVVSMKAILPYVTLNKVVNVSGDDVSSNPTDAKTFVLQNEQYIQRVGMRILDIFKQEFIKEIRRQLVGLAKDILKTVIKQQIRSKYIIIAALIVAIKKLLDLNFKSCSEILNSLINMLNLRTGFSFNIPLPLLYSAYLKEGANSFRSMANTMEGLQGVGFNTSELPDGSINKHLLAIKETGRGIFKELAENGAVEFVSKPATVLSPIGTPMGLVPYVNGKGIILTSF